ncbi:proline-rich receptor-like protein kinase PERK9 [Iris pallida]|uniref:Proline-rich receptor-like protein kinase PERK9 n=1 Tax=Iris pallida TaxID=29817 RepID=A0AAX6G485_IRIPA|nr:proline-rich receptor-like protein kinase PERK9 [Iris pallida]
MAGELRSSLLMLFLSVMDFAWRWWWFSLLLAVWSFGGGQGPVLAKSLVVALVVLADQGGRG